MSVEISQQYTLPLLGSKLAINIPGLVEVEIKNISEIYFNPNEDAFKILIDSGYELLFVKGQFKTMCQT